MRAAKDASRLHEMVKSSAYTTDEWWNPIEPPRQLLPASAYTSLDWFQREREELFAKTWTFAGMVEDVSDPGDYFTVECGNAALVILRDMTGRLRAFHNVCRHRGARLLEGSGNIQRGLISCFYHKWTYNLKGELQLASVPYQQELFPCLDKSLYGLHHAIRIRPLLVGSLAEPAPLRALTCVGNAPYPSTPWRKRSPLNIR